VLEEMDDDGRKKFNLPGGHVELGETPMVAAVREAKEETGYGEARTVL
jgi:8-oxo-dGTP pyrophosphatase MutT (NUDIX family)